MKKLPRKNEETFAKSHILIFGLEGEKARQYDTKNLQNSTDKDILPCSNFHQREPHMRRPSSTWLGLLSSSCHNSETSIFKSTLQGIPGKVFYLFSNHCYREYLGTYLTYFHIIAIMHNRESI